MSLRTSCRLAVQIVTALTFLWIRNSYAQDENCKEFVLANGVFEVCLRSNQNLALGARPILTCELTPDTTDACNFERWELNGSTIAIAKPNYMALTPSTEHGSSFRIEVPSPAVAGIYRCVYSCNSDSTIIVSDLSLPFFPSVEFNTPDNLMYWGELGSSITLNCSINFYTKFLWKYDNDTVLAVHTNAANTRQELDGTSLIINNLTVSDNNTYRCSAKSTVSSDRFIRAYLFVYLRPKILSISNTTVTTEGNRTTMICIAHAVPEPFVVWSKETDLTFGGRFQVETVYEDSYTLRSTLVITHTASSDQGAYHCTAFNRNGTMGTFGSVKETIELKVEVPLGPFLEAFNTSVNATSITVQWIVSGVPESNLVMVEWKFSNGTLIDASSDLPQELTEFHITFLSPETAYVITVRTGSLEYNINVTTPQVFEPVVVSSMIPTSTPQLHVPTSILPSMFIGPVPSSLEVTTPTPVPIASANDYVTLSVVVSVTVLLALLILAVMVVVVIVVLRKKSDSRKSLERNGSLQKPPYGNESPPSYRQQLSGSSMASLPTIATMVSQDSSGLQYPSQHSFTAMDFAAVQGLTGRTQLTALNGNAMIDSMGYISTTPPGHTSVMWTVGQSPHIGGMGAGTHEAFEMTENPANFRFEMEKSLSHQHPVNPTPEPGSLCDNRPGSIPPYLGSESASQVHLHSSHSMPRGMFSPFNPAYPEQEEEFEYTENLMYEKHTLPSAQSQKVDRGGSHSPQRGALVSCSSLDGDSPRFKIVSRERGAVFEEVKIKPQS